MRNVKPNSFRKSIGAELTSLKPVKQELRTTRHHSNFPNHAIFSFSMGLEVRNFDPRAIVFQTTSD